jgi:DNA-binding beta-propeller fold protein YncE
MYPHRLLGAAFASAFLSLATYASDLSVIAHWPVGGGPLFDYIAADPANHRIFASHGTEVDVLDTDTGKIIGKIAGMKRVHQTLLLPELGKGFITDGDANVVVVFDPATLQKTGEFPSGGVKPDGMGYDKKTGIMYVANGRSADLVAFDPKTEKSVGSVRLAGKLEAMAIDGHRLYVNTEDKSFIQVVDTKTMTKIATWPVAPGEGGTGLAVNLKLHRLYTVCGNNLLVVLDDKTGAVVTTAPIGEDPDAAAFDPETDLVYASCLEGVLSVLHVDSADKLSPVASVTTEFGGRTLALDTKTKRVYLPGGKFAPAPAPTKEVPEPVRPMIPGTFEIVVVGPN